MAVGEEATGRYCATMGQVDMADARILASQFLRSPRVLTHLDGERDENFLVGDPDGNRFVLKVADSAVCAAQAAFEAGALDRLTAVDPTLPVPRTVRRLRDNFPVHTVGSEVAESGLAGRRVRMVTFLPGRALPQRPSSGTLRELGEALARIDRAFADWDAAVPPRDLEWDLRTVARTRPLLASLDHPRLVERALGRYETRAAAGLEALPVQVIHNDANPHNVLVGDDGHLTGVIDFGDMVCAPVVQELATACAYQVHNDDEPLRDAAVLAGAYHAVRPLSDEEFAILPALIGARNVLTVAVSSASARQAPDNSAYLMRNNDYGWESLRALDRLGHDAAAEYLHRVAHQQPATRPQEESAE